MLGTRPALPRSKAFCTRCMNHRMSGRTPAFLLAGLAGAAIVIGIVMWGRQTGPQDGEEYTLRSLADAGAYIAAGYTGTVHDTNSLEELRESIKARATVGSATLRAQVDALRHGPVNDGQQFLKAYCVAQHEFAG